MTYNIDMLPTTMFGLQSEPRLTNWDNDRDEPMHAQNLTQEFIDYEFSFCNRKQLKSKLTTLDAKVIVEIGVHRADREFDKTSTRVLMDNKPVNCLYLGIDRDYKKWWDAPEKGIHTIQCDSGDHNAVFTWFKSLNVNHIDLLHIDGYHSVNQILKDWKYAELIRIGGIVAIHDTNFHPGPVCLLEAMDRSIFSVEKCCEFPGDHGISFCTRIK